MEPHEILTRDIRAQLLRTGAGGVLLSRVSPNREAVFVRGDEEATIDAEIAREKLAELAEGSGDESAWSVVRYADPPAEEE